MKRLVWLGDSRKALQAFSSAAQDDLGCELERVKAGQLPSGGKPMSSAGRGVEEIRVWGDSGTYRVIYIARLLEAVYVLHAFQRKTQQTNQRDVEVARARLKELLRMRAQTQKGS